MRLPMSDYGGTFESEFFSGTRVEQLELKMLNDQWQELQAEFATNDWEIDEGLRFTLAAGLAALRAERRRHQLEDKPEADVRAEIGRIQAERMQLGGRYSVMKYRTYQFLQDARTLAMKLKACQSELDGLRQANQGLRRRLEGSA